MAKRKAKRRPTARIYYGTEEVPLWWTVPISDATTNVTINGTLLDALKGLAGETLACHLAECGMRNKKAFGHNVFLISFIKTTCYAVDEMLNGAPSHAIRYRHKYGKLVDLNDIDASKKFIKEHPELAKQNFVLQMPKKTPYRPGSHHHGTGKENSKRIIIPIGALARARKAGLISAGLEQALK